MCQRWRFGQPQFWCEGEGKPWIEDLEVAFDPSQAQEIDLRGTQEELDLLERCLGSVQLRMAREAEEDEMEVEDEGETKHFGMPGEGVTFELAIRPARH